MLPLILTNLLLYKLGKSTQVEPIIKVEFYLNDGNTFVISTDEKTIDCNGKKHVLKGGDGRLFIKVIEGIFFLDEMAIIEGNK